MTQKKICIIGPFPPIKGGISQYDEFLSNELKKESEVYCLSYKRQYPKFLIKNREQIETNKKITSQVDFCIDSINPITWITTLARIRKIKPDLVILPWWVIYWTPMYLFFLTFFRLKNINSMLICHNIYEHEDNALKKTLSRIVLKRANIFLVHTENEKIKLKSIVGERTIIKHLLPIFSYIDTSTDFQQQRYIEGEKHDLKLLFFGFIRPYKGLYLLLEALKHIKNTKVHLTIAGEFWDDKQSYLNYIEKHNLSCVSIIDEYIPDSIAINLFKECDVVVLPYRDATGSGIVSSAYGYHKPVLVTNVGGLPDAVLHKETGYIVDVDAIEIANGIEWFSKNNNIDFKANINAFVIKNMSWSGLTKIIYEGKKQ